jgi:hypothetical protein
MMVAVGLAAAAASMLSMAVLRGTTHLADSFPGRAFEAFVTGCTATAVGFASGRLTRSRRARAEEEAGRDVQG